VNTTTIQVEKPTKELLIELKESYHSKTFDDVIKTLVKKKTKLMYGKLAKGKNVSAAEMMKNLRDKRDRL
jgi:predicted CopG family antitoxin